MFPVASMKKCFTLVLVALLLCTFCFGWLFWPAPHAQNHLPVLQAAGMVLLLPVLLGAATRLTKGIMWLLVIAVTVAIIHSQNRAALLGSAAGVWLLAYLNGWLNKKRVFVVSALSIPVLCLVLVFFLKTGSSKGRLLIYKVITQNTTAADYIQGIGAGKFKSRYNAWQAAYFKQHDINCSEALLADNTYFAFNDYLQFVLEYGITGILFILAFFVAFLYCIKKAKTGKSHCPLVNGALAALAVIVVAAAVSYPLQNGSIQNYLLFCLLFVGYPLLNHRWLRVIACTATGVLVFIIAKKEIRHYQTQQSNEQAALYSRIGYKHKAGELLNKLIYNDGADGNSFLLLAKMYYNANQKDSAIYFLNRAEEQITNLETTQLYAKIYEENGWFADAEQYYLKTVRMVPNRFESRWQLTEFYLRQHDTAKALYWAKSIEQLPVKIPSDKVERIKNAAWRLMYPKNY